VHGCNNYNDASKGISIHKIPFFSDERPEAKRRRKQWVDFVQMKRKHWEASKGSSVCSSHFKPDDFHRMFIVMEEQSSSYLPRLKSDELGIASFPSLYQQQEDKPLSQRTRRQVRFLIF
jgi:hypothetical protein